MPAGRARHQPLGSLGETRFVPGSLLGRRFRLVARLGSGGMGEVYRADDMVLGAAVALKFLPPALQADSAALARLRSEVRVAREVAHPNVCRIYDIGEAEGEHFISMEYVDGEDLAVLLRRIGRLPAEKAVQIAQQLCAGLAAVHARGIVHRDLKPANVMLDGRGHVRLTDFGIAALAEDLQGGTLHGGTPAYMAPEQLDGREASVRSDLYSLGLVLYELFTGRAAIDATSIADIRRFHDGGTPADLRSLVQDVDPAVERVILRCLEPDARQRPRSALEVAAALPGGDPLAAALAAGETPSPEMVAAAGEEGLLRPARALGLLAAVLLGLAGHVLLADRTCLVARVHPPRTKTPQALADHAAGMIRRLGHDSRAVDTAYGFEDDRGYLSYLIAKDATRARWQPLRNERPAALTFWYRESPEPLIPQAWWFFDLVSADNPSPLSPGMINVRLDPQARLLEFLAPPAERAESSNEVAGPDWAPLFDEAGLDPAQLSAAEPIWRPPVDCDVRSAWTTSFGDVEVRVEAGAAGTRLAAFRVFLPWDLPEGLEDQRGREIGLQGALGLFFGLVVFVGGLALAWRNLRLKRGDRRGAFRLAVFVLAGSLLCWLFAVSRFPPVIGDFHLSFFRACGSSLFFATATWVLYIVVEPYIRRRWPRRIIAWSRALSGRWRDPLVGRDILVGLAVGAAGVALLRALDTGARALLGAPDLVPPEMLYDFRLRALLGDIFLFLFLGVYLALLHLSLPLLLQVVVRKLWLALVVYWALWTAFDVSASPEGLWQLPRAAIFAAATLCVLFRFGLLAGAALFFAVTALSLLPGAADLWAWYAQPMLTAIVVIAGLAVFGFWTSLAGRQLVRDELVPVKT